MAATRLSFSYPESMKERLQALAQIDGRSLSGYIQRVLEKHLEENTSIKPKTRRKRNVIKR